MAEVWRAVATLETSETYPVPPLSGLNPAVPQDVEQLAGRLLERDPSSRIGSSRELAEEAQKPPRRHDPDAGARDLALLVGPHGVATSERSEPAVAELARELAAFVDAAGDARHEPEDQPADLARAVVRGPASQE